MNVLKRDGSHVRTILVITSACILSGCGPDPATTLDNSNMPLVRAPTTSVQTTAASRANTEGTTQDAGAKRRDDGRYTYIAISSGELPGLEARQFGMFRVVRQCVVFDTGHRQSLAIFSSAAKVKLRPDGLQVSGRLIRFGETVTVGGGYIPARNPIMTSLQSKPPSSCPKDGTIIGALL